MEYKNYYKILGLPKNASAKEIKAAFRKLARKYHPDVNPGNKEAEARFKEVSEANEVLSDPQKRKRYDELGANWRAYEKVRAQPGRGTRVEWGGQGFEDVGGFSDFFRTFFGGGVGSGSGFDEIFGRGVAERSAPPPDAQIDVQVTLHELASGTTRTIRLGEGDATRTIDVKIPPGLRDGSRVRVAGEGHSRGSARGDLYLAVGVIPHPEFEVHGDDLTSSFTVPLTTAVLGGEAQVPTLDGPVGIRVPSGSPVGRTFRLREKGLPRRQGGRGDLLTRLGVEIPGTLSDRERALFEDLKQLGR